MLLAFGIRNRLFCWINSIMWELIQFTYSWFSIFNYQYARECWFDIIIFDILIFNGLGIELGLLILRYMMKNIYRMYPEWNIAFKSVFCFCKYEFRIKYLFVAVNMLFLWSLFHVFTFAFYGYTFWLTGTHYLSVIRFNMVVFSCVCAYGQLYKFIFKDISCVCVSASSFKNSYWIIVVWTIIILEFALTLRHYLQE